MNKQKLYAYIGAVSFVPLFVLLLTIALAIGKVLGLPIG